MAVLEFEELLDSSDMGPEDWLKIAATIETHYYDYDGFVVIHGARHHPSFTMFL
jgi:L-asparaginase